MPKPKVIIVGKLPPPFIGPAVATQIILNSGLRKGFNLLHLNTTVNKSVSDFGKGGGSKVVKNFSIYKNLYSLLKRNKVELTLIPISQTTLGFLKDSVFILIASLFRTKILLQLRGSNFKNWMSSANGLTRSFVKFCLKKADGIIVLGNNLKHLFEDYYSAEQIHVVPNGCNINLPEPTKETDKVQLLYFANLLPSKGIKEVLEALVPLSKSLSGEFELKAVGAWDNEAYRQDCMQLVKDNKLPVRFFEPQKGAEKWKTFANADIFVFTPNMPEGHPWVLVEALSAGLPVISTNQGAIIESVIQDKNGFIVESNQPSQIYDKLKLLIQDSTLRKEFGLQSRKYYREKFTEDVMIANLSETFYKILNA